MILQQLYKTARDIIRLEGGIILTIPFDLASPNYDYVVGILLRKKKREYGLMGAFDSKQISKEKVLEKIKDFCEKNLPHTIKFVEINFKKNERINLPALPLIEYNYFIFKRGKLCLTK